LFFFFNHFLFQLEKDFEKLYPQAHMKLYAEWAKLSAFVEYKLTKVDPKFKTHSNPDTNKYITKRII